MLWLTFSLQGFQGTFSDLGYSWTLGKQLVLLTKKKAVNYIGLISKDILKSRVQMVL